MLRRLTHVEHETGEFRVAIAACVHYRPDDREGEKRGGCGSASLNESRQERFRPYGRCVASPLSLQVVPARTKFAPFSLNLLLQFDRLTPRLSVGGGEFVGAGGDFSLQIGHCLVLRCLAV